MTLINTYFGFFVILRLYLLRRIKVLLNLKTNLSIPKIRHGFQNLTRHMMLTIPLSQMVCH